METFNTFKTTVATVLKLPSMVQIHAYKGELVNLNYP